MVVVMFCLLPVPGHPWLYIYYIICSACCRCQAKARPSIPPPPTALLDVVATRATDAPFTAYCDALMASPYILYYESKMAHHVDFGFCNKEVLTTFDL